jgi:hypothetical protein
MPKKITYEFVKQQFKSREYELLSEKYINARTKLRYVCSRGHIHSITWSDWLQGYKCPFCAGNVKLDIEFIRSKFVKEGYKLLTTEYKNNRQKLSCICPKGHKYSTSWGNWALNRRCPCQSNLMKPTIEFIRSEFAKEDYILKSTEYINNKQKLKYICLNGHEHSVCWSDWQSGKRCPYCVKKISKGEVEVRNFIKSLGVEVLSNDRSRIFNPKTSYGLELDIFIPALNKAIEYNGEYWHQDKARDLLKQQLCKEREIGLLTIWDRKWKIDNVMCKNKIRSFVFN